MFDNPKTESIYNNLLDVLVFISFLTKKETFVFLELFNIAQGKAINDIESNKSIDCFVTPRIKHFEEKLGVSKDVVKRLNKKIILCFSGHIQIERQKFDCTRKKGYDSINKYIFKLNTFLSLFLLKKNGFLKNNLTVHNSLTKLSENQGLIYDYVIWATKKSTRSKAKKAPAFNYIIKLINLIVPISSTKKFAPPKGAFEKNKKDSSFEKNKYDKILPKNKTFGLTNLEIENLLKNHNSSSIKLSIQDAIWYEQKGKNKIRDKFSYINHMCYKVNDSYAEKLKKNKANV